MVRWNNFEALFTRLPKTAKQRVYGWDFHAANLCLALLPSALLVMWLEPVRSRRARVADEHRAATRSVAASGIGGGGPAPTHGGGGSADREAAGAGRASDDAGTAAALALRIAALEQRLDAFATDLAGRRALPSAAAGGATLKMSAPPSLAAPVRGGAAAAAARRSAARRSAAVPAAAAAAAANTKGSPPA